MDGHPGHGYSLHHLISLCAKSPLQPSPLNSAVAMVRGKISPGSSRSRSTFPPANPPVSPYVAFSACCVFLPALSAPSKPGAAGRGRAGVCTKVVIQALAGAVLAA